MVSGSSSPAPVSCADNAKWLVREIRDDLYTYSGTSGGTSPAAVRGRLSVVILEFGRPRGKMIAGRLDPTNLGKKQAIGSVSREFYQRIGKHLLVCPNCPLRAQIRDVLHQVRQVLDPISPAADRQPDEGTAHFSS